MLYTIGYEGRSLDEFLEELVAAEVDRLIDVRQVPLSRKRGFSKSTLAAALATKDIAYVHLKQAGNPFRHEAGDVLAKYAAHLDAGVVAEVAEAAKGHRAALLCYERHPGECHRSILAGRVVKRLRAKCIDL